MLFIFHPFFRMFLKKYITGMVIIGIIASQFHVFADDISDTKAVLLDTIAKLVQKYETRIQELQTENSKLTQELASLRGSGATAVNTGVTNAGATPAITAASTKADIYSAVIKQANANLGTILSENSLPAYSAIGLLEFIEPNAVFLSLDDGNNPADVTAFKTKILYTFDENLSFTKVGLFELDYASQKYRTIFGNNPYTKSVRTRMENPSYKGKLFDVVANNSTGNNVVTAAKVPTTSSTGSALTIEGTLAQIKTAYSKNKNLDVLKMSENYILKNPNDIEVLKMRYRSYYFISQYDNSLTEIKKIETLQGATFEKTIACDAAVIGKIAKKSDVSTYYSAICKKK